MPPVQGVNIGVNKAKESIGRRWRMVVVAVVGEDSGLAMAGQMQWAEYGGGNIFTEGSH